MVVMLNKEFENGASFGAVPESLKMFYFVYSGISLN